MAPICRFAVGSPDGPRSAIYRIEAVAERAEVLVEARAPLSRFEARIPAPRPERAVPPGAGAGTPRERVRQAIAVGAWASGDRLAPSWPGKEVAPGVLEPFSVHIPASGLRAFSGAGDGAGPVWIPAPADFGHVVVTVLVGPEGARIPPGPAGAPRGLLGAGALADGRRAWVFYSVQASRSPLQAAGMFTALRKRRPAGLSQEQLLQPGMRLVFLCEMEGAGLLVEVSGDTFFTTGAC
jgi:hypothetical protein